MKLALSFCLLAVAIASSQRFLAPQPEDIFWLSPYSPSGFDYDDDRHLFPYSNDYHYTNPANAYMERSRNALYNGLNYNQEPQAVGFQNMLHDDSYFSTENRNKNKFAAQFHPSANNVPEADARFFFFNTATVSNPFLKTATYTLTSSVTLTNVRSCIVVGDFLNANAAKVACRRRRKLLNSAIEDRNSIDPAEPSKLETTLIIDQITEKPNGKQRFWHDITSSFHETDARMNNGIIQRAKRFFFFNYVVTTTLTTYVISSTVSTKTVDLGNGAVLNCMPSGYVTC